VRFSIIGGAFFALIVYLFWQIIALGSLPITGADGIIESYEKGIDAAQALKNYLKSPLIGTFAQTLAFFAILTSFLAQTLSIVHFLSDGLKIPHKDKENIWICLTTLIPPLIFASLYPHIFYKALNFAGGICAVILFGLLPVLMIWRGRYNLQMTSTYKVYGGKKLLSLILVIAFSIFIYQISQMV
jgi:tyrosine-specific transport protein